MTRHRNPSVTLASLLDRGVIDITRGFPSHRTTKEGGVPVHSLSTLRGGDGPTSFAPPNDREIRAALPNDVLVGIEGTAVGEVFVVPEGTEHFTPSQQIATLRVLDPSCYDPWFIAAWFISEPTATQLRRLARGHAVQRIQMKDLRNLKIAAANLADQKRVGERLKAFEETINAYQALIPALRAARDADLHACFTDFESID